MSSDFIDQRQSIYFRCVENCAEAIMITDTLGRLQYVNPAWQKTYGYQATEVIGKNPRILRSNHQGPEFYAKMWEQILGSREGTWRGELMNRTADGRDVPVLLTINPYKDAAGETLGYMGIAVDLTEKHKIEQHLSQQERLATLGELTSGLAHEIGTPIGVIRGRAEMLLMNVDANPVIKKTADIVIRQADRISGLITTLLRFSRAASAADLHPVTPSTVLADVQELLGDKLAKHQIELQVDLPKDFAFLGDESKLEQILINLLMNSTHAILARLETDTQAPRRIRVYANGEQDVPHLYIEDSGPGIAPALRAKVFQPFFSTKPAGKGTGLGLSIASRLAHEMKGQLELDQQFNEGARFVLTLQPIQM